MGLKIGDNTKAKADRPLPILWNTRQYAKLQFLLHTGIATDLQVAKQAESKAELYMGTV